MRYEANPVIVDAFKITFVSAKQTLGGSTALELEDGSTVVATAEMTARMTPVEGDYWVIQEDGYIYLNPAKIFERKYHPLVEKTKPTVEELEKILNSEDPRPVRINEDGSITPL